MPLLEISGLTKKFGGLVAVEDCSFVVEGNMAISIIGPNGAGKTTIFNMISGLIAPTSGSITFMRNSLADLETHEITSLGIGRTFQNIQLFKEATVLDNVKIGRHCRSRSNILSSLFRVKSQQKEERDILQKSKEALAFVGLDKYRNDLAMNLSYGDQKRLEIARALVTEPKLLMLDEPNSGMNTQETMDLVELVRRIKSLGITVLLISHHMNFVQNISDHVFVLNYGKIIAKGAPWEIVQNEQVIEAYLGKAQGS
jgi:branched-chain amino acid transport system ATP-binding protein